MKSILLSILFVFSVCCGYSQSDTLDQYLERLIENYAENNDEDGFDFANSFEILEEIRQRPYNLNLVTLNDLENLFFLNPIQRNDIINHRNEFGDFIAMEELQTIKSLNQEIIGLLRFYVVLEEEIKNKFNFRQALKNGENILFVKYKDVIQNQKGYTLNSKGEIPYKGNDKNYFLRYKYQSNNNFKIGFTAEKDYGEPFFNGANKQGFDFYSGYLSIDNVNKVFKKIIVGDYSISLGQGLILQNNFGAGKSAFVMNIKSGGQSIKPYSSVNESNYFRGVALQMNLDSKTSLLFFGSFKKIDTGVSIDSIDDQGFENITSIARSGYHRTTSEIANKGNNNQANIGLKIGRKFGDLNVNAQHVIYDFSLPFDSKTELYRKYAFTNKRLMNSSIDYNYQYKNLNVFGEIARSDNGGIAQLHSLLLPLDRKLDMSFSYRNYGADYQVIEANAFGEASQPVNEKAIYWAVEARPSNKWKFSAYVDLWKNPWLRYRVDAPSNGKEILFRIEYNIKRKFNAYLQFRTEDKPLNANIENAKIDPTLSSRANRLRINFQNKVSKEIELRSRAEYVWNSFNNKNEKGYLIYQDLIYKPIMKPLSFTLRYALFDTDGFNTRIYTYENDILYEFAIPFLAGNGQRSYINLRYRPLGDITLEARYALTRYERSQIIGSGNDAIEGKVRSDVKFQIRYQF